MKKILNLLKVEYIITIIIFLTVVYKNFMNSLWYVGIITLVLNLLNLHPSGKKDKLIMYRLNKWRINVNALFSILLILYGIFYKDNAFLLAGCIAFIVCLYNLCNVNKILSD